MGVPDEFGFTIEYAKSARSTCRTTKQKIEKGALRIGKMVQSQHFDGRVPQWHYAEAFFRSGNQGLLSSSLVHNWDEIRPDDQHQVEAWIKKSLGGASAAKTVAAVDAEGAAKSKKGKGKGKRASADDEGDSKQVAKKQKKQKKSDASAAAAAAAASPEEIQYAKDKAAYDKEVKFAWKIKDKLATHCTKPILQNLLQHNGVYAMGGDTDLQQRAKDILCYGVALSPGEEGGCCNRGVTLTYDATSHVYKCGQQGAWGSCLYTCPVDEIATDAPEIPPSLANNQYLSKFSFKRRPRVRRPIDPSENIEQLKLQAVAAKYKAGSKAGKEAVRRAQQAAGGTAMPFADLVFCLAGKTNEALEQKIEQLGGVIKKSVTKNCTHLIATEAEFKEGNTKVKKAQALADCVVVEPEWVERTFEAKTSVDSYAHRLDLSAQEKADAAAVNKRPKVGKQESQKLIIKGRSAVDPLAGEDTQRLCHVLDEGGEDPPLIWDFVGNVTNLATNTNSYYGLQLIEADDKTKWWVFRKWGRVGTDVGGTKLERFDSVWAAKADFEALYADKTGNDWWSVMAGRPFKKRPGKFFPIARALENEDSGDASKLATVKADARSKLDPRVQDLMCLIFDVKLMEDSLREMEIDLKKMPLGNLKKSQIQSGYEVLTSIQTVLEAEGDDADSRKEQQLTDLSNQFYTLIPHDFGLGRMKLISSLDDVRAKVKMIEALLDIEAAVTMLSSSGSENEDGSNGPKSEVDQHYEKLHCKLKPVEPGTTTYEHLETYVNEGKCPTGLASYEKFPNMKLKAVFEVVREGEFERFEPQKSLGNRRLLWHGSRTSNFGGILSQGKGAYFADVIGKSASYCRTSGSEEILIMACDVALGQEFETKRDKYMDKAQPGTQCTHALGKFAPTESGMVDDGTGCMMPLGQVTKTQIKKSSVNVNEFIVYNVNQCNIRYLLRLNTGEGDTDSD